MARRKAEVRPSPAMLQCWANAVARRFNTMPIIARYGRTDPKHYGHCELGTLPAGTGFNVVVSDRLRERASVQYIMEHELAHAVAWFACSAHPRALHGPEFGLAAAAVHRFLNKTK